MHLKSISLFLILSVSMSLLAACAENPQHLDLLTAIDKEKSDVVQKFLDSGIDPNEDPVPRGISLAGAYPLHLAVVKGNTGIAQILLANGAKLELKARNKDGAAPLAWAAFFGQKDMVLLLIEAGADINAIDSNHLTPLDGATFARIASEDDAHKEELMAIITILKANGGKHSHDL